MRIHGLDETTERDENLETRVLGLMLSTGTKLTEGDLAARHRTGKPSCSWPVLVCFVSRKSKVDIMRSKNKLKEKSPKMFINDDLTRLRSRLLGYTKKS